MFKSMKIGNRLAFGFGLILILLSIVAYIGITRLSAVQANFDLAINHNAVKIRLAQGMSDQVYNIALLARNMALSEDPSERKASAENIEKVRVEYNEMRDKLDAMLDSDEGKKIMASIKADQAVVKPLIDKAMKMASDFPTEAGMILMREAKSPQAKWFADLHAIVDLQEKEAARLIESSDADYRFAFNMMLTLTVLSVVLGSVIAFWVTRNLLGQLGGEPGEAAELARSVASGDLSSRIALKPNDTTSMMAQLGAMQTGLARVVGNVRRGSEEVASTSAEIARGNQDLSARTESQASSLEEAAASMEELSSQVKHNADNAHQANQLASNASAVAVRGGEVVGRVVETMKDINESSRKISDIISVIDGIAFQTNILALNAAVEAARAGEQGRGFAVVANEVRSLAGRSADAAKEIKGLITASVEKVEQGTTLVDEAGVTMTEVVSCIQRVSDIVSEISSASNEQAAGVAQVGEAVSQMDQVTQQNAALVEQMAAAASSLKSQSQDLVQVVAAFKLEDSYRSNFSHATIAGARSRESHLPKHANAQLESAGGTFGQ